MTNMENSNVIDYVKNFILNMKLEDAQLMFECKKNKSWLLEGAGDIIPLIASAWIKPDISDLDFALLETFFDFYIVNGSPKENLLYLMASIEEHSSQPLNATIFFTPLQRILLRMPDKRGSTLNWVLSSLSTLIRQLQPPMAYNYEGDERKLLDLDPEVSDCKEVLKSSIDFLKPFVEEVTLNLYTDSYQIVIPDIVILQREKLCDFIVSLMGHPLAFLDLHHEPGHAESQIRLCVEKLVGFLAKLKGNLYSLITKSSNEFCSNKDDLSSAILAYVLIGEVLDVSLPYVFSPAHIFVTHIPYSVQLLGRTEDLIIHKGLLLSAGILANVEDRTLTEELLVLPDVTQFPTNLFQVMIFCKVQEHRKKGLKIFKLYLSKFNFKGQCHLLNRLIQTQVHSGVKSLILNLYKEGVHEELKGKREPLFTGRMLQGFVKRAIHLPDEEQTDLLNNNDVILAALNFLRYLFIFDKRSVNITGIWNMSGFIKDKLLEPLQTGLKMSIAHYELELKNWESGNLQLNETFSINVAGENLPPLTKENYREFCLSALTNFDLIRSVLVRLEDIISSP